ncbi:MAG: ARMT1-like domain-containing protein [Crenarchaeota archaeon]|nr:ARMT1-like domain-containing protein [Thermoproteota archaeon]MCR8455570.1 ARMT1-like domain-containing protein [Thermoproteota archaeon]MCR8501636.1 ARMT1-like domain-containing protein [Thermoproteota archaeon]
MKVKASCFVCLLERALRILQLLSEDERVVIEALRQVANMLVEEFTQQSIPAILGTKRERIIAEKTGVKDPYRTLKEESNKVAQEVAQKVFSSVSLDDLTYENFRRMMILAAAANAVEWFVKGYEFSLETFENELTTSINNLAIDDSKELYNSVSKANRILYILDNAGEAVIDLYAVRYLSKFSNKIYVGARASPVLNDITVEEAKLLGFEEVAELVPVGDLVGVVLEYSTEKFKETLSDSDLVIAKGMGAYETLTEYKLEKPVYVLLKAKCEPIAKSLGVRQGSLVIKRLF